MRKIIGHSEDRTRALNMDGARGRTAQEEDGATEGAQNIQYTFNTIKQFRRREVWGPGSGSGGERRKPRWPTYYEIPAGQAAAEWADRPATMVNSYGMTRQWGGT